jgi:hypothetical protein
MVGVLSRQKYRQQSHLRQSLASLRLKLILKVEKVTYKSPGADHIPAELILAGGGAFNSEIHKLIKLIWNKEELYLFTKRVIKLTVVIIGAYNCCQLHTKFYPVFFSLG